MKTDTDRHCIDLTQLSSREQLSALMDNALPEDQTRFLLRRLQHDAELAGSWERWRVAGDVLRGSVPDHRLPADFAQRVASALHGRALPVPSVAVPASGPRWSLWGGGAALAAALAVVALMPRAALQTPSSTPLPATPAPATAIPTTATPSLPLVAGRPAGLPLPSKPTPQPSTPQLRDTGILVAAAVAVAKPVRRSGNPAGLAQPVLAKAAPVLELAQSLPVAMPSMELASRPWPRKILPQYAAGNGLTVGFADQAPAVPVSGHFAQPTFSTSPGLLGNDKPQKPAHAGDTGPSPP